MKKHTPKIGYRTKLNNERPWTRCAKKSDNVVDVSERPPIKQNPKMEREGLYIVMGWVYIFKETVTFWFCKNRCDIGQNMYLIRVILSK